MNLFLMHRKTGKFSLKKNSNLLSSDAFSEGYIATRPGEPLDMKTVNGLAKNLKAFLDWLIVDGASYEEVIAAPLSRNSVDEDVCQLPIWRYHSYLCERVKTKDKKQKIGFKTAQGRITAVRDFYLWTYKRGRIDCLPFSVEYKQLKFTSKKKQAEEALFGLPNSNSYKDGHWDWVSNLRIPKKIKQKQDSPDDPLQPYSSAELVSLLTTDAAKHRTYGLQMKCAYLGGLRSFEIVAIDYEDIFNPDTDDKKNVQPKLNIIRKGHKPVRILVSRNLMKLLYKYTLDDEWVACRKKHEIKYGMNVPEYPLPLFINRSGERMKDETPGNVISIVRKEQRKKAQHVLKRTFHDLRSTFGTYVAMYLIQQGESEKRIRLILRTLMSHENFATTEGYIDFAKITNSSEYGAMADWVQDIYKDVEKLIEKEEENVCS